MAAPIRNPNTDKSTIKSIFFGGFSQASDSELQTKELSQQRSPQQTLYSFDKQKKSD
jgi:hypothetical protein